MIQKSVLAVTAALHGSTAPAGTPVKHTAEPNAPPSCTSRTDCGSRGMEAGKVYKFLPAIAINYPTRCCCAC